MTMPGGTVDGRRRLVAAATAAAGLLLLSGCFGSSDEEPEDPRVGSGPLAAAQQKLLDTSGVDVTLSTEKLPGRAGVRTLTGTLTAAPAFKGKVDVRVNDLDASLPMVAVDGAVYAQLPFTETYVEVDPAAYGAPDPAELLDPDHGLAGWLGSTEGPAESEDGKVVTGTIPGQVVAGAIPSASAAGTFKAEWHLDADGLLEEATITGPFYGRSGDVTYLLDLGEYDLSPDITAPAT